ncbi:glycoside hydrolase family 128 protein, partial [Aulographum hederae CBS 113979]
SNKRGLVYVPSSKHPTDDRIWTQAGSDLSWYYNYGAEPSAAYLNSNMEFVPMLWGASDGDTGTAFLDTVTGLIESGTNISYVLAFNEPDGDPSTGGSAIPADLAAATWIREIEPLKKLGVKLCAPGTTGAPAGFTWLENFFKECRGRCSASCMPVHWYGNFEGLASHVGQKMAAYPNMTIWVTEYAYPNGNLEESQSFYNQSAEWFDRMKNITHYSYFGSFRSDVSNVGANAAMLDSDGDLTDIGSWYLGGAATGNVPTAAAPSTAIFASWSAAIVGLVTLWI